jgi:hypothetical protein
LQFFHKFTKLGKTFQTLILRSEVKLAMGVIRPDEEMGPKSEESQPADKYYRPSAGTSGGLEGPFGETETWWKDRFRLWLVDRDGKARKGKYVPESDGREKVH